MKKLMCILEWKKDRIKEIVKAYPEEGFNYAICQRFSDLRKLVSSLKEKSINIDVAIIDSEMRYHGATDTAKYFKFHFPKVEIFFFEKGKFSYEKEVTEVIAQPSLKEEVITKAEWNKILLENKERVRRMDLMEQTKKALTQRAQKHKKELETRKHESNKKLKIIQEKIHPVLEGLVMSNSKSFRRAVWKQVFGIAKMYRITVSPSQLRCQVRAWKKAKAG